MSFSESIDDVVKANRNGLLDTHPSWKRVRLNEVAVVLNGFAFSSKRFTGSSIGTMPLIRIRDIKRSSTETYFEGTFDPSYLVRQGDLLIGMDGDFNAGFWTGPDGLLNQRVCKVVPNESHYDRRFLNYVLPGYLQAINASTSSITVKHLSSRTVEHIPLPLPSRSEQRRISDKLDELFSDLNAGVAALERAQANLKRYRAAVLKAAVEGKLTEQWRTEHPDVEPASELLARILKERRAKWEANKLAEFERKGKTPPKGWREKYIEPAPPDTSGLPELTKGWCWTSIGECFEVHVGSTPSRKTSSYWDGVIPWVSSGEVQFGRISSTKEMITEEGLRNCSTQLNPSGSVLLGMIGEGKTRGQTAILDVPACNNQNCAAVWVSLTPVLTEYVFYWFWSQYEVTRSRGSGNNQPALNKSRVEQIPMPLPPIDEQRELVRSIEELLSIIDNSKSLVADGLRRGLRLRESILKRAFEGKLVPQDPADEPASVLLERIRARR